MLFLVYTRKQSPYHSIKVVMELINDSGKSKVYKCGSKVYKFRSFSKKKAFEDEMTIYNKISSLCLNNVIKFSKIDRDICMIEMDYYPYDLESYFAGKYEFILTETQKKNILYNVIHVLYMLNTNSIVHGDFKAKNILLDKDFKPFITDFDLGLKGTLENDVHKLKLLICQMLYKMEYKPNLYNNFPKHLTKISQDYPELHQLLTTDNLLGLMNYFRN